jgi:hypothetical protein
VDSSLIFSFLYSVITTYLTFMKHLAASLLFFAIITNAYCQDYTSYPINFTHHWNEGKIVFHSGDTLSCQLRFNRTSLDNVIHVLDGDQIISVIAADVHSFSFFDIEKQRERNFISMTLPALRADSQQFLVEKIYDDGKFSILTQRTFEMPFQSLQLIRFLGKPVPVYKKFVRDNESGQLLPLNKENTMKLLEARKSEVSTFIHERHIRFKRISDFINVFEYHNSL